MNLSLVLKRECEKTVASEDPDTKDEPEFHLTAIPSDRDSGLVLMQVCGVSALREEILEGKGHIEITLLDIIFFGHNEIR